MSRITLKEFASDYGQTKAASLLGMSQSALNKALQAGRDVHVTKKSDGTYSAEEVRPFPCRQHHLKKSAA
jgi:DNA-binding transcriptional regulator YdaS (Cro superfamily)